MCTYIYPQEVCCKSIETACHELEAVQKHKIIAQHESHIALPVIWNAVYAQILLLTLTNLSNGLHDEMGIIPTAIMKDY